MSQPDLFVICKNCGAEVSPYVTECPYCGQRVRKRAPKIARGQHPDAEPRAKRRGPRLSRLRPDEIEGIAPDTRPVVTIGLIAISLAVTLAVAGGAAISAVGGIEVPEYEEPWRYVTAPFVHNSLAYQFVVLLAVGVFGAMVERRFGWFPVLVIFLAAGSAGAAAAVAANLSPPFEDSTYRVLGANGAALGILFAWLVDDRRAAARGHDRGSDLLGVRVFAAVLLLLPLAIEEASAVAGVVGAATGTLLGLALPLFTRR